MSVETLHAFVVPAYGRSAHLHECLASLHAQSRPSPIVIATSTPFDGIGELASEFGAALAVHGPNGGIGRDWNQALSHAPAPWVTIAHQDDIYLPDFAETTLALIERVSGATLVLTGYGEHVDGDVRTDSPMLWIKRALLELGFVGRESVRSTGAKRRLLRFGCPIPCPSVTINLAGTRLHFREDLRVNLDWDAWLRLANMDGAFAYDRGRLMLHRIHPGSETTAGVRDGVRAREDRMMFDTMWPRPVAAALAKLYSFSYDQGLA